MRKIALLTLVSQFETVFANLYFIHVSFFRLSKDVNPFDYSVLRVYHN